MLYILHFKANNFLFATSLVTFFANFTKSHHIYLKLFLVVVVGVVVVIFVVVAVAAVVFGNLSSCYLACGVSSPNQTLDWTPSKVNVTFGQYENTSHWYVNVSWTPLNGECLMF